MNNNKYMIVLIFIFLPDIFALEKGPLMKCCAALCNIVSIANIDGRERGLCHMANFMGLILAGLFFVLEGKWQKCLSNGIWV